MRLFCCRFFLVTFHPLRLLVACVFDRQVLAKLKSITHELESKELDVAAKNLQVHAMFVVDALVVVAVVFMRSCCSSATQQSEQS